MYEVELITIQMHEDSLARHITDLWKKVNPTPEEIDDARFQLRDDDPTDIEVLRVVIEGRTS